MSKESYLVSVLTAALVLFVMNGFEFGWGRAAIVGGGVVVLMFAVGFLWVTIKEMADGD